MLLKQQTCNQRLTCYKGCLQTLTSLLWPWWVATTSTLPVTEQFWVLAVHSSGRFFMEVSNKTPFTLAWWIILSFSYQSYQDDPKLVLVNITVVTNHTPETDSPQIDSFTSSFCDSLKPSQNYQGQFLESEDLIAIKVKEEINEPKTKKKTFESFYNCGVCNM